MLESPKLSLMGTHTASPNNHRSKLPPAKAEDLGSVLERFENWVGKQQTAVRELSYAEAIARSRRRHPQTDLDDTGPEIATPSTAPPAAAAVTAAPKPAVSSSAAVSAAAVSPSAVSKSSTPPASRSVRAATKAQPATASAPILPREEVSVSKAVGRKPEPEKTGAPQSAKKAATKPEKAAAAQPEGEAAAQPEKTAAPAVNAKKGAGASARKAAKTIAPPAAPRKAAATPKGIAEPPQPATFQQALAAQLAKAQTTIPAETATAETREASAAVEETAATVSIPVALTSAEHARIEERAAQLGLTPGAYLRQCAWEVESLRSEVQKLLLARMQAGPRKLAPVPKSSWLSRLKRYLFSRRNRKGEVIHA
jgi:hypothetical protein